MIRTVHLHGRLAKEFGESFRLEITTPAEAVRALCANFPGRFLEAIKAGEWHVVAGPDMADGVDYGAEEMLSFGLGKSDLHLAPAICGSGEKGGFFQVVLGIALVATAFALAPPIASALGPTMGMGTTAFSVFGSAVTYGNIAAIGGMLMLSGAASLLTPTPQLASGYESREQPDERRSFLFNGAKNTTEQGTPVPIVYGEHLTGWTLVSSGTEVEQI